MGFFNLFKKKEKDIGFDATDIVTKLDELGYFKYADAKDIPEIKEDVKDSLIKLQYLSSVYFDNSPYNSKDYRHYHFDGEDLFEQGGFIDQLNAMKSFFDKIDFKLDITNHIEDWDAERGLNHSITLNGKNYIIFQNFNDYGWGEAAQRFAEIINDQLEIQKKDERLYLSNGGNDGHAVYLTQSQFELLDPILQGIQDKPLKVADWCKAMEVDMKSYLRN